LSLHFHISVNAKRQNNDLWGEYSFVQGLSHALIKRGVQVSLFFRDEEPVVTQEQGVVLRIAGPHLSEPCVGFPNLLWIINPLNFMLIGMLNRYQSVFCASQMMANQLSKRGVNANCLLQATEVERFHPNKRPPHAKRIPILFVGAYSARARRQIVLDTIEAGFEVQVWGPGWEGVIPNQMWHGKHLSYECLALTYASADIILNSHMRDMAQLGIMNNRSFDAISSGAVVISDKVAGFERKDLTELIQITSKVELVQALNQALGAGPADDDLRLARHQKIASNYSFDTAIEKLIQAAHEALQSSKTAPPAFLPRPSERAQHLRLSAPNKPAETQCEAMQIAASEILVIKSALEVPRSTVLLAPTSADQAEIIHSLTADLRKARTISLHPDLDNWPNELEQIAARARLVGEALESTDLNSALQAKTTQDVVLQKIMSDTPGWVNSQREFSRNLQKRHVVLSPRKQAVNIDRSIGVFVHLYYAELAEVFAQRLAQIEAPVRLYVSTDTADKASRILTHFPDADVRVMPNRGRDIYPKFFGFSDTYQNHDIVLHLHSKRSLHAIALDEWLEHILDCLLPSGVEINRIISYFQSIPTLGVVVPVTLKKVLPAAHWGANCDIARELAYRLDLTSSLPADSMLRFPVGSMFWARVNAIRPLVDLQLELGHFPPEAGQVDCTLAHAIERIVGVVAIDSGHQVLSVAGQKIDLYKKFQRRFKNNGDLRRALISGNLDRGM
jgi:hypothetical protein